MLPALPRGRGYVVLCWFTSALAMAAMSYLFWQRLLNLDLTVLRWERIVKFIRCLCRRMIEEGIEHRA
jgi:hypothetical protein